MAHIEISGLGELMADLDELAGLPDSVVEDMLDAGADVLAQAQRSEIRARWKGPYSLGISAESVKKGKVKRERAGSSITVYPRGTRERDGKSVRNAEIAFINEFGARGRHIAPRPAIDTANKKKEKEAVEAEERVYHAYLDSKKL